MSLPRVLLADDHTIVLQGLRELFKDAFEVVGTATDGLALVEKARALRPDVIVTDISMPLLNGIEAVGKLREAGVDAKVVFLTMHPDAVYASRAISAGASGYVLKHAAAEELVSAIRAALRGDRYLSIQLATPAMQQFLKASPTAQRDTIELTERQRDVLKLLAEGKSAKEIGAILDISPRTVEAHKYKMIDLLGFTTTAQLIHHAIKHGLVGP